jgi:predicted aminopeptidase
MQKPAKKHTVARFLAAGQLGRRLFYLVHWAGYPEQDSWVSANVLMQDLSPMAFAKFASWVTEFIHLKPTDIPL